MVVTKQKNRTTGKSVKFILCLVLLLWSSSFLMAQKNNLALTGNATAGTETEIHPSKLVVDGDFITAWISQKSTEDKWVQVVLPGATNIKMIVLSMEADSEDPIQNFSVQIYLNGTWRNFHSQEDNMKKRVTIEPKKTILNDRIRLAIQHDGAVKVNEFEIYGIEYVDTIATPVKKILVNQSGYNLGKPKRFTVPEIPEATPFAIRNTTTGKIVFEGIIKNHIGDFSDFNPQSSDEFKVVVDTLTSYPFKIGPFWLERVSYRNMVDFMIGARHYTGTTKKIQSHSWAWRDGDFYNWSLQSLVAQYLSNPEAYKRMDRTMKYVSNDSYPSAYKGKWGALEPYSENTPDIVKLIHWDADVKISQGLEHEMQKAELVHFLYAYPYLREWLPQQNFDTVYQYLKNKWEKETVAKTSITNYDRSESHNLLTLKTKMGTTKGELPPGHSVIPNLMMYEVAKKQHEKDAEKYFDAAYRQMEWMIKNLDWEDPITTKGQRMSEHITTRAFAYFHNQYGDGAPAGLVKKVEDWAAVMLRRSDNLWDFRKYTDNGDWVPTGWNETGNVLGFPACALAAKSVINNASQQKEMDRLVWSHFDNAFGRNPTGRHFSYDGPTQIEGVELGWYNEYKGGIGLLEPVRFVFDGSPKTNHYPNHPEIGNLGWTEGWVQFNTAYDLSIAYLAYDDTAIELSKTKKGLLAIRLKTPLNFDEKTVDEIFIEVTASNGDTVKVKLTEESPYSKYLSGKVKYKHGKIKQGDNTLQIRKGDMVSASYGLGYFQKEATISIK